MKLSTILKKIGKFFSIFLLFYLTTCFILSFYVTFGVLRWEIIENRGPFFVLSVERSSLVGKNSYQSYWGFNHHGEYLGFGSDVPGFVQGKKVTSLFLYAPGVEIDNVAARWDFMGK